MVIVGQAPNREQRLRWVGFWASRSGRFFARCAGLTLGELRRICFANVIRRFPGDQQKGDAFPIAEARAGAKRLRRRLRGRRVLMLGGNVARAFGLRAELMTWSDAGGFEAAVVPHPSGVNRWWNDPRNRAAARRFLRRCVGEHLERRRHGYR
jgi:uracil-DNA glycosylase